METAIAAGAEVIKNINTGLQFAAFFLFLAAVLFGVWMVKLAGDSKKLIAEKEAAEKERTEKRTVKRDAQIDGITSRFDAEIKRLGEQFIKHVEDHKVNDDKTEKNIASIDERLRKIEANLIERKEFLDLCNNVTRIMTILDERAKHEHVQ